MADTKDIAFKVNIDGVDRSINTLKELKQAKKDATDAFIKGDKEAAKTLAELKDKTEDLNDATKSLKTDGVEGLTGSFSLLREGFASGDMDKAKTGLKGIGSAMSAIPILLLVEGFKFLIENFQEVIKFGKILFNLFSEEEKAVRKLTKELENQKKATALLTGELNREIALMEAQGVSGAKLLAKKKELIEAQIKEAEISVKLNFAKIKEAQANDTISESYTKLAASIARKLGQTEYADKLEKTILIEKEARTKKEVEDFNASIELLKDLRNKELVEVAKVETEKRKEFKKTRDEEFANLETKGLSSVSEKKLEEAEILGAQLVEIEDNYNQISFENKVRFEEKERLEKVKTAQEAEQLTQASLQGINDLSSIYFSLKLANVKKGSKEEEDILRKQFEVSKKFQIAQAVINGAQAVTAILSVPDFTFGIASAIRIAASVTATALTVAKIASTQFQSATPQGSVNTGGSNSSSGNVNTNAPNVNNNSLNAPPTTTFTGNNNNNFNTVKAVVVETDNRNATNRINKLTSESAF